MKSMTRAKSGIGALAAIALGAFSATSSHAQGSGWTANATIAKLVGTNDGSINVRLSPEVTGCVSVSGYGPNCASMYAAQPGINRIKAILLTAYSTGASVALYLSGSNCTVGEVLLGGW